MRYRIECPANRYVIKSRLNCSESTAGSLRQSGSEFQTVGLATEKAQVPKVPRRTRGTNSWWRLADRRCWRPGTSETGTQYSARQPGARCWRQWWTVTASLYCTRWGITSQCRSACISVDRLHSYFRVPVTRRAAAFWTCCNLSMTFFGAEDKTELQ